MSVAVMKRELKTMQRRVDEIKEGWPLWLPADAREQPDVITRHELMDRLATRGIRVTQTDFIYWQTEGIIPKPIKRWQGSATLGLWPPLMEHVIVRLVALRKQGRTLRSLGPDLKEYAAYLARGGDPIDEATVERCPCCGQSLPQRKESAE